MVSPASSPSDPSVSVLRSEHTQLTYTARGLTLAEARSFVDEVTSDDWLTAFGENPGELAIEHIHIDAMALSRRYEAVVTYLKAASS